MYTAKDGADIYTGPVIEWARDPEPNCNKCITSKPLAALPETVGAVIAMERQQEGRVTVNWLRILTRDHAEWPERYRTGLYTVAKTNVIAMIGVNGAELAPFFAWPEYLTKPQIAGSVKGLNSRAVSDEIWKKVFAAFALAKPAKG